MRSRLGASGCHNWLLETVGERLRHMTSNMHLLTHITQSVTHLRANCWIGIQYGHSDEVFSWNTKCPNTNSRRTVKEL